jgi:hypothetical protein
LPEEVARVHELRAAGLGYRRIARLTGISIATVRTWIVTERPVLERCSRCGHPPHEFDLLPPREYAYLLGIHLGDGTILRRPKGVWFCTSTDQAQNYAEISSYSKSWPCLIPQTGPGLEHKRKIELSAWQWAYLWQEPGRFIRGLIHSDGCRVMNKVIQRKYAYPRYFFSNESTDIQQLFRAACDLIGVEYRNNRRNSISVARRASVALLDEVVGPKR